MLGKIEGGEEKVMTEDVMVRWHLMKGDHLETFTIPSDTRI